MNATPVKISYAKKHADRLAKVLRENLLKRKQQQRQRQDQLKGDTHGNNA
jgi:hypothetical protein